MSAARQIVNGPIARPAYIGLPCSSSPGVPLLTSTSIMNVFSSAQWAGIRQWSKTTLCDPLPLRPSRLPQSSSIVHSLFGATNSSIWGASGSASGITACPM